MALINIQLESQKLMTGVPVVVSLPESYCQKDRNDTFLLVYVLHGTGQDQTSWIRNTNIQRYAARHNMILVFPYAARSVYSNQKSGLPYWDYITQELPVMIDGIFNFHIPAERTYVAGLSMGGYGALKWGFSYPDRLEGIIALSSGIDRIGLHTIYGKTISEASEAEKAQFVKDTDREIVWQSFREFEYNFGSVSEYIQDGNDLYTLLGKTVKIADHLPDIYMAVGLEDHTYESNVRMRRLMDDHKIPYTYEEEHGTHEWAFWDKYIERAFQWITDRREVKTNGK